MKNHFRLFDYTLDIIDKPLSKEIMIDMNKILKRNTTDEENPRYNVGGFKVVPNKIGLINVINTSKPEDVEKDLDILISEYEEMDEITLEDIIDFHYKFELIHPFGDGNGRVGRMIMFKECLRNNIMPFIVLDNDKPYYMRGLKNYKEDKMFLIDTIRYEQDLYENIVNGKQPTKDDISFIKRNPETITVQDIDDLMSAEQELVKKAINVTLKQNKLQEYFPPGYSKKEMENVIYSLLDKWRKDKN